MTKTFTQSDLIRYIYDETSHEESIEIQHALLFDGNLNDEFKSLRAMVAMLDQLMETQQPSSLISTRS